MQKKKKTAKNCVLRNTERLQKYHLQYHFIIKTLALNKNCRLDYSTAHAALAFVPVSVQLGGEFGDLLIEGNEKLCVVLP